MEDQKAGSAGKGNQQNMNMNLQPRFQRVLVKHHSITKMDKKYLEGEMEA